MDNAGNFASDALHVVERFTMIDRTPSTGKDASRTEGLHASVDDGVRAHAEQGARFEIWEQACHEGNQSVRDQLDLGMKPFQGVTPPARERCSVDVASGENT
jgi:hypothetical protein